MRPFETPEAKANRLYHEALEASNEIVNSVARYCFGKTVAVTDIPKLVSRFSGDVSTDIAKAARGYARERLMNLLEAHTKTA